MSSGVDDRLLIPVADLPGPVPDGAPRVEVWSCPEHGPQKGSAPGWRPLVCTVQGCEAECGYLDALDLSPPPTDATGWPTRVDGLDVAVGMLARALGEDTRKGVLWHHFGGQWTLVGAGRLVQPYIRADIDPTAPLAPRLAIVACFRARVWEGR